MKAKTIRTPFAEACHVSLTILLTFLLFISNMQTTLATTTTSNNSSQTYQDYIKIACNSTTYPEICYNSLASYASTIKTDPQKLCNTALSITLKAARNESALVSAIAKQKGLTSTEKAIVKDCIDNVGDSVDELKQSLKELEGLQGSDVQFHMANLKTWVSAAITDEETCTDGFNGNKVNATVKNKIRNSILNLAKLTSISLALIDNILHY
ncbi:PMEI domain-containing protein [Cephalotus follicularis]|uniref:PMEI domain-containing protein n=1 Tax=Cephalotus follicularis TaxID=3775 RepID=A0A1Q3BAE3_CEPFO|nr:PMEI domain-containing protein [Cephalotus follicularis]